MLESFPISLLVGTVLGFLAGLGVGGGSLLMLWLTAVLELEYSQARTINLLFFLPCAVISSLFRIKKGSLPLKKIWPAILSGICSALLLSQFSEQIHTELLKKALGILLIGAGLRELFYRPRNAK